MTMSRRAGLGAVVGVVFLATFDATSTFIRSIRGGGPGRQGRTFSMFRSDIGSMRGETEGCAAR
jgi:hypothetical protein